MPYLLDTNHCSYIINGNSQVINALNDHVNDVIGISIITYAELLYMTNKSLKAVQNRIAVEAFLTNVDLYFIDEETAIIYSGIKASVFNQFAPKDKNKRRHTSMSHLGFTDHDLWIVATAIQHELTLVSTDSDFKRINQVQPFSWESWM
ncbi:Twitching motility protein PilT [Planktothrix tepida]|uniref:Twitching motility protein PilT n=1 Tax=Planktothrix tepida PCC 9214 TaxID=671072 RepID=A0A1J1LEC9_9CYAN|nr:type II toxin-antitoxin system VapC family toxin [Planktothrix tepida]CAD5920866.1 Twitching motility protein PilT [Planktothrix tepida]CUR30939.1 Twitching motility protein PilT [Planktothrix tepida PCC 9214]